MTPAIQEFEVIPPDALMPFDHAEQAIIDDIPACPSLEQIDAIEKEMLKREQVPIETKHYFCNGLYAREIFIPAGILATGAIHLEEYIVVMPRGDVTVTTSEGVKRIKAPATFVAKEGTKHIGYIHEDTIWVCIHACKAKDVEAAEKELVVPTLAEYRALLKD